MSPLSALLDPNSAGLPPAILLMGPTASGKSSVALQLAQRFPVEIVSVDSAQVYRDMDIGTAKPDLATRSRVHHHLIDLIEPPENYSAARFCHDALEAMAGIVGRGHVPLLTGGTMLYFKALREGLAQLPAADEETRQGIDARAAEVGWPQMHRELERIDPATAQRLDPNDAQRIQRALEVIHITGEPMSGMLASAKKSALPYRSIALALVPHERAVLHQRIAERFDRMLERGLVEEVRGLREKYDLRGDMPSMRCVGYRQVWQHLEGEYELGRLREKAVAATRQLAKRQLTWLRSTGQLTQFDCLAEDLQDQVERWLRPHLGG